MIKYFLILLTVFNFYACSSLHNATAINAINHTNELLSSQDSPVRLKVKSSDKGVFSYPYLLGNKLDVDFSGLLADDILKLIKKAEGADVELVQIRTFGEKNTISLKQIWVIKRKINK